MSKFIVSLFIGVLILGLVGCRPSQQSAPEVEETRFDNYAGSEACAGCHATIYNKFMESGHPYIVTEVKNGEKPTLYPFSRLPNIPDNMGMTDGDNTLGAPANYWDVSYVIGGFKWKANFLDANGYVVTGSDIQYLFETGNWGPYETGVVDKPYDCGRCHTTGWKSAAAGGGRQDNLPGMGGSFFAGGIHCEECHGEGAAHVNTHGDPNYINVDTSSELCGRCHTLDSQNRIAASAVYIRHHQQYDELLGINPDNVPAGGLGRHMAAGIGCNTCHDPHATTAHMDSSDYEGVTIRCEQCHADKVITSGAHSTENLAALNAVDQPQGKRISNCLLCHMPKAVKSAVGHYPVGTGPYVGDMKSHIFKIDLTKTEQFTADGKFAYPWLTGEYACKQCHNGVYFFNLNFPRTRKIHTTTTEQSRETGTDTK